MRQTYGSIELEMHAFTGGDKVLYNVIFYTPTEDKKHRTPYDGNNSNKKGSLAKQLP
jgi:hypothetical protein